MAQPIIGRSEFSFYLLYTFRKITLKICCAQPQVKKIGIGLRNPGSGTGTQNCGTRDFGTQILGSVPGIKESMNSE